MPTTTEAILKEDGAETALAQVAAKVAEAETKIRDLLFDDVERVWSIRELQDAAAYEDLSPSVISIAFLRLEQAGVLHVDADLLVHALS